MTSARLGPIALPAALVVAGLLIAVTGAAGSYAGMFLSNAIELGAAAWAVHACLQAGERTGGHNRLGWRLLAGAAGAWWCGQLVWSFYDLVLRRPAPFPSIADVGFFLAAPLTAAAIAFFPSTTDSNANRLRAALDAAVVVATMLGVGLSTFLGEIASASQPGLGRALSLAYPIGDFVIIGMVLSVLARIGPTWRRSLGLIGIGLISLAVADVSFAYLAAVDRYDGSSITNVGWIAGFVFLAFAAREFPDLRPDPPPASRWLGSVPYAAIVVMVPIGVGHQLATGSLPPALVWCAMAAVLLTIARQMTTQFENLRLADDVRDRMTALEEQEAWVRRILETSSDAYLEIEVPSGVITGWNDQASVVFGWSKDEAIGHDLGALIYGPEERTSFEYRLREYEAGEPGVGSHLVVEARTRDGRRFPMEATVWITEMRGERRAHAFVRDVSERIEAEDAVRRSERRWRSLVRNASDVITVLSAEGEIESATPAAERMLGWTEGQQRGRHIADFIHPDDRQLMLDAFAAAARTPGGAHRSELRIARRDGTWAWVEVVGTNMLGDPDVGGFVYNVRDVSERREIEEQLRHQATHDPLTGLPNRSALTAAVDRATAQPDSHHSLLLMDLDRFKEINDGLGHAVGDRVLIEVARRLREATRAWDVVSRLGGDEFAVLATDVREDATEAIAKKLLERVSEPIEIEDGFVLQLSGSLGIAVAPLHGDSALLLLQKADVAMYRAKESGAGWAMYGAGDAEDTRRRVGLVADLGRAEERHELALHYQPKVDLKTGRVSGVEALLRWNHPQRGSVSPGEFIPLAEHTGLIRPITRWVLRTAIAQARTWQDEGIDIGMAVNVSPRSLGDPDLMSSIIESLVEFGVDAKRLTLEITETAVAQLGQAGSVVARMRHFGVRISVDDFGTGYSSMTYLKNLPIDELKIDQSFVLDVVDDARDKAIVQAIVTMARSLGLSVVAEGAESEAAVRAVADLGCDLVQGYAVARPAAAADLTGWLLQPGRLPGESASLES